MMHLLTVQGFGYDDAREERTARSVSYRSALLTETPYRGRAVPAAAE
jgi:hypothetical protein